MPKIPKRFQLGPHVITVTLCTVEEMVGVARANDVFSEDEPQGPWGLWVHGENAIYLQRIRPGFNAAQQQHTFWHEYHHAVFDVLNYGDLSEREELVDQCGLLLSQFLQTAKY